MCRQRIFRDVDDVVEKTHGRADVFLETGGVDRGILGKGFHNQAGEVDRAEKTGTVGRQRLFTARVCATNFFAISEIVGSVDPVDENDAGFGIIVR